VGTPGACAAGRGAAAGAVCAAALLGTAAGEGGRVGGGRTRQGPRSMWWRTTAMPSSPDRPKRMKERLVKNLGRQRFRVNKPMCAGAETVTEQRQEQHKSQLFARAYHCHWYFKLEGFA